MKEYLEPKSNDKTIISKEINCIDGTESKENADLVNSIIKETNRERGSRYFKNSIENMKPRKRI